MSGWHDTVIGNQKGIYAIVVDNTGEFLSDSHLGVFETNLFDGITKLYSLKLWLYKNY